MQADGNWIRPDIPVKKPAITEKRQDTVQAVVEYLENKVARHSKEQPDINQLIVLYKAGGWKYGGTIPLGHRITIRDCARVIHVHMAGKNISRAHFMGKLREDERADGTMIKKLALWNAGTPTTGQGKRLLGDEKLDKPFAEDTLKQNLPLLAQKLRALRETQLKGARYELIIYDDTLKIQPGLALKKPLLKCVMETINSAMPGAVDGLTKHAL